MTTPGETQHHIWTYRNSALNLKPLAGTAPKITQQELPYDSISYESTTILKSESGEAVQYGIR